jgi:hypothetical protein
MITPTLIQNLAWKGYLIFMCLNLVFVPVRPNTILVYATMTKSVGGLFGSVLLMIYIYMQIIYFFYPETANLTLEEIDFLFTDRARYPSIAESRSAGNGDVRVDGVDGNEKDESGSAGGSVSHDEVRVGAGGKE